MTATLQRITQTTTRCCVSAVFRIAAPPTQHPTPYPHHVNRNCLAHHHSSSPRYLSSVPNPPQHVQQRAQHRKIIAEMRNKVQEGQNEERSFVDRTKNLMIFRLDESESEDLDVLVKEIFLLLGMKPTFKAERLGRPGGNKERPVKVWLESSSVVTNLLNKSKDLKNSIHDGVFLKPDRTPEQRGNQRKFLAEARKKSEKVPNKQHKNSKRGVDEENKRLRKTMLPLYDDVTIRRREVKKQIPSESSDGDG